MDDAVQELVKREPVLAAGRHLDQWTRSDVPVMAM